MSPHTPGPWKVGGNGDRVVEELPDGTPLIHQAEDTCILTLDDHEVMGSSEWMRVSDDDACLIAAAPELLTACEMALNDRMFNDWPAIATALSAAIAKAKGVTLLLIVFLAVARPVQASWDLKPYAVLIAGQMADVTTTVHQINTPALHCREANPLFGAHPSTMKLVLPKVALVAGVSLLLRVAETKGTRVGRNVAKAFGYAIGAMGATAGAINYRTCGW
jgi:hypothetical protein